MFKNLVPDSRQLNFFQTHELFLFRFGLEIISFKFIYTTLSHPKLLRLTVSRQTNVTLLPLTLSRNIKQKSGLYAGPHKYFWQNNWYHSWHITQTVTIKIICRRLLIMKAIVVWQDICIYIKFQSYILILCFWCSIAPPFRILNVSSDNER